MKSQEGRTGKKKGKGHYMIQNKYKDIENLNQISLPIETMKKRI